MIIPNLRDIMNSHKALIRNFNDIITEDDHFGEWKIQLTIQINFISPSGSGKNRRMDSKMIMLKLQ